MASFILNMPHSRSGRQPKKSSTSIGQCSARVLAPWSRHSNGRYALCTGRRARTGGSPGADGRGRRRPNALAASSVLQVAALAESVEVAQPVVARVVAEVGGGEQGAGGAHQRGLGEVRPARGAVAAVAPRPRMLVEPAPVGQAAQQRPVWPAAVHTGHRCGRRAPPRSRTPAWRVKGRSSRRSGTTHQQQWMCSQFKGIPSCTTTVYLDAGMEGRRFVGAKVRFSVSIDPKTNEAIEQLAKRHKPELSKSYIVEYALVRLLDAMERKQLNLPLVLEDRNDGRR